MVSQVVVNLVGAHWRVSTTLGHHARYYPTAELWHDLADDGLAAEEQLVWIYIYINHDTDDDVSLRYLSTE